MFSNGFGMSEAEPEPSEKFHSSTLLWGWGVCEESMGEAHERGMNIYKWECTGRAWGTSVPGCLQTREIFKGHYWHNCDLSFWYLKIYNCFLHLIFLIFIQVYILFEHISPHTTLLPFLHPFSLLSHLSPRHFYVYSHVIYTYIILWLYLKSRVPQMTIFV